MATQQEEALEKLGTLKTAFAAAVVDAQEDAKRWKFLRHYTDPKARETEFAGYAAKIDDVTGKVTKGEKTGIDATLKELQTAFDAVVKDSRADAASSYLESYFPLSTQEAESFEGYSKTIKDVLKLVV